jgi:hypothetical protein
MVSFSLTGGLVPPEGVFSFNYSFFNDSKQRRVQFQQAGTLAVQSSAAEDGCGIQNS